jgi:two-component system, NarL family, nitrate/nitrite response regulator NarL
VALSCLIVDDSKEFLASVAGLFSSQQGLDVVGIASTGNDALRLMAALSPDVVLVDVELGDEDGIDLARRMTMAGQATSVILISLRDPSELAELIGGCGAAGFVRKDAIDARTIANLVR